MTTPVASAPPSPGRASSKKPSTAARIDPDARVTVQDLEVRGELKVSARTLLAEIDSLIGSVRNAQPQRRHRRRPAQRDRQPGHRYRTPAGCRLQMGNLTTLDCGSRENPWTNLGWNAYYDGGWKRLDADKPGANLHISGEGAGQEFRFLRMDPDGSNAHNIAVIGSKVCAINDANLGIGTAAPNARLDVRGAIHAGGSDIYFTETTHRHTGFGNTPGFAAIENDGSTYNALMILGRSTGAPGAGRQVVGQRLHRRQPRYPRLFAATPHRRLGGGIHTWDVEAEGTIWSRHGVQTGNRDLAENFDTREILEAGDVVSLDPDGTGIVRCRQRGDPLVLGVVSSDPGLLLGADPARRIPARANTPLPWWGGYAAR
jgi:hypothetical protein